MTGLPPRRLPDPRALRREALALLAIAIFLALARVWLINAFISSRNPTTITGRRFLDILDSFMQLVTLAAPGLFVLAYVLWRVARWAEAGTPAPDDTDVFDEEPLEKSPTEDRTVAGSTPRRPQG